MIRDNELAFHNLLVEIFIILTSEWEASTEESKQKDSASPYVSWRSAELFFCHNFWSHIRRCSTENLNLFIVWNACAKSEIDNLNVALCI